jgi:UDP-N-acetylmuramyl pentapeptide phosphotransferase/UDP-N-acetylglucosamine-1-phosphate transferase
MRPMNYNVVAYSIFVLLMSLIIFFAGRYFHKNGRVFILDFFDQDIPYTDTVNNSLLVAYYLFNIGYTLFTLHTWNRIDSLDHMIAMLSDKMSILILILSLTHYFNMSLVLYISNARQLHSRKNFKS